MFYDVTHQSVEVDAYTLGEGVYQLADRLEGDEPEALPPFLDLTLDPVNIWV